MIRIPKRIFPAVMFARSMIRNGEAPGLAVYKAARYYNLEQSEVATWIRRKNPPPTKAQLANRKWAYGLVFSNSEADPMPNLVGMTIGQAANRREFNRKMSRECENKSRHNYTGSVYRAEWFFEIGPKLCATKKEANEEAKKFAQQRVSEIKKEWNEA